MVKARKARTKSFARMTARSRFFELADRLAESSDASERKRIKAELARLTFGE